MRSDWFKFLEKTSPECEWSLIIIIYDAESGPERSMTEGDKLKLKKAGYTFMDITDHPDLGEINVRAPGAINISLSLRLSGEGKSSVKAMMKSLDDKHLRSDITKLSSFWNRSYRSAWGALSSNWIHDQVESVRLNVILSFL